MGFVVWLTGVVGVGKSTIGSFLEYTISEQSSKPPIFLDGTRVRQSLYPWLGYSKLEREFHHDILIKIAETAVENGYPVIIAAIAPYKEIREKVRNMFDKYLEVYLYCDFAIRLKRDKKNLYWLALTGEISDLTGYNGHYDEPESPDLSFDTGKTSINQTVDGIIQELKNRGWL